ncbi:BEACH domain-containing protein B-like isoform X1 [Malus sylvestris]|uniref:BEACH domain-containing protein B-like isoform X1 n=3 Tax=Malus sylvestris TaxID=3752 RepID=UPI0021AD0C4C|nr:BEACH domain-containing protein B-like isoform X1 [Malus sylvestris]XP_050124230.1 BEACH domain-containing protein B-like isoform X1 [Malus sylvestris]XP_050124231.1 BEACH domain-containing protein B-like isoform X1 [Malus sylvestris]
MNIVKGVADLIRRTSGGHDGDSSSGTQAQKFSPPGSKIRFSEVGDEAVLNILWDRYEKAVDKVEKRRLFHVFLKQFLAVCKNWQPVNTGQMSEAASTTFQSTEYSSHSDDVVIGCFAGHPAEVILVLTEEITHISSMVADLNNSTVRSSADFSGHSATLNIISEGMPLLDALMIVTRSLHNCRVFGYYGGIQKLTALMKGAVVQLKTISGALSADEKSSNSTMERTGLLQQILVYVVSIICSFIDLNSNVYEKGQLYSNTIGFVSRGGASPVDSSGSSKVPSSEIRLRWQQRAVVSVMEAGGLNWLVELLRVIKRLSMKEQWTDTSLLYLSLRILYLTLAQNPRGQNHFKSIGGLEVLLDGLGIPSSNVLILKSSASAVEKRFENPLLKIFQLHVLSLEVLKEAVFGNISNLQFLCENGRVHKFANSFCSPAFMFQEYKQQTKNMPGQPDFQTPMIDFGSENNVKNHIAEASVALPANGSFSQLWSDYAVKLSRVFCSFLPASEDFKSHDLETSTGRTTVAVSSLYGELSIKWIMRVLHTVFPCIKACSNQNELPSHLRVFVNTLQHCVLNAFRNFLVSSPVSLKVFREEGIWELIFSENFFYFGPASDDLSGECCTYYESSRSLELPSASSGINSQAKVCGIEILQMEVISFVEFAATSSGSAHNLPELSALLDALEHSACNPEVASVLAKSLRRVLQLSAEKTVASFKAVNAFPRVLKVACIQAQESRRFGNISPSLEKNIDEVVPSHQGSKSHQTMQRWLKCMETSMELYMEFFLTAEDARSLVLHSTECIGYLFDLFWEEGFRDNVLRHIFELMKTVPSSEEDQRAKLQLFSKYLEMFTQIKEREKSFAALSIYLLVGMRDMLKIDPVYYQTLFRDGECFLHVVSLLNGNLEEGSGENLVLNVLQTLTCLLASNDTSKATFRVLAGKGYQTLQSLLLEFCQSRSSEGLLNALLDMLVDGKFDMKSGPKIKNEDVIILYLRVLRESSDSLQHNGLDVFQQLLRDSISNQASCVRAGMLNFLLDWFSQEDNDSVILKIAQLIQVVGGHSTSGKDIRKIFALLRSEKVGNQQKYCSLLLSSVLSMLNEKGPTAFFDFTGNDSGIIIKTPVQWPLNKGFSFSCWLRVENFPRSGKMGLFNFLAENGRGCMAALAKDKLVYESINLKRQSVQLQVNIVRKKWHFLCITHSIGRAFSGGSLLRCYVDGDLVSSERCRYAKVNELLTSCRIGAKFDIRLHDDDLALESVKDSHPFLGQIGPVYVFNDAISSEQVQGIYSLGPSYMYSFLDSEATSSKDNPVLSGILDAKDGLASKILFGLNAQACDGRKLFNVSPMLDHVSDKNSFEATVMVGTQQCSRRLLQQIIYCVGGVSVFFPLIAQSEKYESEESGKLEHTLPIITRERVTAEVIELIASVLDENLANQQQMHLLSGFSILGFLLQSVPPQQLNLETLSALKHLFYVVANCGLAELLTKEAISSIFLNPLIWLYTAYKVQRELYMFLIQQFDNDPRLLKSLCRLPRVIDIIRQFYWDNPKSRFSVGNTPLLHPITKQVLGERPSNEEIRKIRLVLLSLGEMSLRQKIAAADIRALIAFFETSQDSTCIEDVLHMLVRALSQKPLLAAFLEQVNLIGGCQMFVNLLQREYEPIRLLSLQLLGRLLVGLPSEKKGARFFNLAVGRSRFLSDGQKKISMKMQPIFSAMSDRLFRFPQTDNLCASLFDALLGGASPKQVLQKHHQVERQRNKANSTHFLLPQILVLIFRFLSGCEDAGSRMKIVRDLLDLLDSDPSNVEAFMEFGWNAWLTACVKLGVFKNYKVNPQDQDDNEKNEQDMVRNLFGVVLCYYVHSVKGGWQQLEDTVTFLLMQCEHGGISFRYLLRDIYKDLISKLVELSSEENIFISQPCRDNTLYLLRLVDEMLISEIDQKLPFPASNSDFSLDSLELERHKDYGSALYEVLEGEIDSQTSRIPGSYKQPISNADDIVNDQWWNLYDNLWIIISEMNGKGPSKMSPKPSPSAGPSLGQRARGLVESLNIPAAEVAAVVVSGGIGSALGGKPNKNVDKAMLLRGERCPRIIFRLVILYLCRSSLERASRCVQQVISLLPCLLAADDEQSKSRLQLFIWALLVVRSQFGMLDDGARFHVISHLIRETVNFGKSMLATSMMGREDSLDSGNSVKETGSIQNLIQRDRVLAAVGDEAKYTKSLDSDRQRQLCELQLRMDENSSSESNTRKAFEDEIQSSLASILALDDSRRAAFQLAHEEEQQNVAEKWIHMFRALIDERGPWSANPFPNSAVRHWKLDKIEDAWRRRQKLRQNYHFDEKLCHPSSSVPSNDIAPPVNESKCGFVGHIPEQMKRFLLKGVWKITDDGSSESNEIDNELGGQKPTLPKDTSDSQCSELSKDSGDWMQERKDSSSSSLETETSEVLTSVPCVLVTPKRKLGGYLAVMKDVLHFFGEFLVEGSGGSSVFRNFHASSNHDLTKPDQKQKSLKQPLYLGLDAEKGATVDKFDATNENVLNRKQLKNMKRHRRWNIGKIKAVCWTRYLLRYSAIEIFFSDSSAPVFLNFASQKDAKDTGTLIVATRNEYLFPKGSSRDKNGTISFVDRRVALEMAETARESWRRRDMTNFEYLMILNTLAGRSYNDLTQYPVFPWVLADYSSEVLDFNKSSTFRDLSKPVGALDIKRFEVFEDRYRSFTDPDIPSFYYGSHYSSMGIVLYYLLRLEPFTSLHRNLQGGKFDHADRLFQSIEGTYQNCLTNTSDVKELIPEFFYMPEFLVNSNAYHFGVKQDGEPIADVCLPPWAKGSPEEFINKNREALESEYVSSNLHHWIDLVFGYKQRGKPAVEAANIFYYLTYEGAVDLETMEDDLQRSAIEDQIANFGQTPIQIFRKKHPRRGPPIPIAHPLRFAPGSINLTSIVCSTSHTRSAALYVRTMDSNVVLVSQGLTLSVKMWLTTSLQSGGNFTFSSSQDPSFGVGSDILSPRKFGSPSAENVELGAQCFATMQTPSENFLISCGNWENSFQVISLNDGRMVQSIRQHKDVVSCVAVTFDGSFLATGSYDTTIMVWKVFRGRTQEKRPRNTQTELPRKDYVIVETPFRILCGHDDIITCLYISVELDIVISGSKDGTCVFHTLQSGRYVRSLRHPSGCALSKLVASQHGRIVFYADDDLSLHLYSINGKHLASSESNGRLNCVELSGCGEFLVCAGDQGQIVVRSMNSLEVIKKYDGVGKIITSLTVTPEECFLAGTKDGTILVYSIENTQLRKGLPRNSKSKPSSTG